MEMTFAQFTQLIHSSNSITEITIEAFKSPIRTEHVYIINNVN
jgi:hypothetical protein